MLSEAIVYTKNRIFTFNKSVEKFITFYKIINKTRFNVFNFRTLKYKVYTYISKTIKRYKLNNRS